MSNESLKNMVRLSMSDDIYLELDRMDNATLPATSVSVSADRNPDRLVVSLKGVNADHVFLIDTYSATLQTLFFRTHGGAVPWSRV